MTTPDKEEMPKDRTAGPWIVHYGEAVKIKDANGYTVASLSQIHLHGRRSKNEVAKTAQFIVTACNAYEPMREALILAEKADRIHSKCQECEDGAQAPEACGDCFPSADDARVARRNVLKSLGVRMRDVDRARAIKAEPSICNCSQEDVHDYGPCGEDCRSLVGSTHPVNDRHHSGSDSYQADAGAPALSEKVNVRSEWLPIETAPKDGTEILAWRDDCGTLLVRWTSAYELLTDAEAEASGMDENALHSESWFCADFIQGSRLENETVPSHWMPLPSPPGAELNFSNEAERDGVSLKSDTSSQPASSEPEARIVTSHALPVTMWDSIATAVVKRVAELPDRSSPDNWPEAMLVTSEELHRIIISEFDNEVG